MHQVWLLFACSGICAAAQPHVAKDVLDGLTATIPVTVQAALTLARTDKSIMSKNMKKTEAILREMVMITLRSELTKIQRTNLETCVTIHMHQKESTGILLHILPSIMKIATMLGTSA